MKKPCVVYIAGLDRSGSTLLSGLLESFPDSISVGELPMVWRHGWQDNWRSSDGHRFRDSPTWTSIISRMRAERPGFDPDHAAALAERIHQRRHLTPIRLGLLRQDLNSEELSYIEIFDSLYTAIAECTKSKIIIDAGKMAYHSALMQRSNSTDFREVHIVRDPRAVAYSRSKYKVNENTGDGSVTFMVRHSALRVALRWIWQNFLINVGRKSSTPRSHIDYLKLTSRPVEEISRIIEQTNLPLDPTLAQVYFSGGEYTIQPGIAFSGNSQRFDCRVAPIAPDNAWKDALPWRSRVLIEVLTFPFRS